MVTPKKGLQEPTMFDVAFTTYFRIAAMCKAGAVMLCTRLPTEKMRPKVVKSATP